MKVTCVQTCDLLNGKWKNLCPKVAHFCGVYHNVTRRDYIQKALDEFHVRYEVPFTLLHACEVLKDFQKWKQVELPLFEEQMLEMRRNMRCRKFDDLWAGTKRIRKPPHHPFHRHR
ncbi:hypothetical protein Tco_0442200 [Tanacetum coccineum]